MALLQDEIKELRLLLADYQAGKASRDQVMTMIAIYSQAEKRIGHFLHAYSIVAKSGKGETMHRRMIAANLIGDNEAIDVYPTRETEKVCCSAKEGQIIDRSECLDFSGQEENKFVCRTCEVGKATKKYLLG
jgi:hypothetical protein